MRHVLVRSFETGYEVLLIEPADSPVSTKVVARVFLYCAFPPSFPIPLSAIERAVEGLAVDALRRGTALSQMDEDYARVQLTKKANHHNVKAFGESSDLGLGKKWSVHAGD